MNFNQNRYNSMKINKKRFSLKSLLRNSHSAVPSKQPQSIDSLPRHCDFHRNRFFEAATTQFLRSGHNRWIRCASATIFIEIDPLKQTQRSSFEAPTVGGFTEQGKDSHRNWVLSKQPHRGFFDATTVDGIIAQGCDSHRNQSCEAAKQPQHSSF